MTFLIGITANYAIAADTEVVEGSIVVPDQPDIHFWTLSGTDGTSTLEVTLVCGNSGDPSITLDPALTVFSPTFPRSDDDSFTPCETFHSSIVNFAAGEVEDGCWETQSSDSLFGDTTGPYTLTLELSGPGDITPLETDNGFDCFPEEPCDPDEENCFPEDLCEAQQLACEVPFLEAPLICEIQSQNDWRTDPNPDDIALQVFAADPFCIDVFWEPLCEEQYFDICTADAQEQFLTCLDETPCEVPLASIHVLKFNAITGEGIEGWEILLECTDGTQRDGTTDGDGMVWFEDIPAPNLCEVSEELRPGWTPTTPPSVTVELNPEDDKEVTFGNVRALETEKFYTETEIDIEAGDFGVKLPFTDDDTQTVQAVIHPKNGKITSYNPGQYYAVTKVTAFVDLATVSIFEEDFLCTDDKPISIWNPAKVPGGAYVAMMCPDGTTVDLTSELANADPPQLFRNTAGVLEAHVEDVKAGCMVFLGVKYSPGLKGFSIDELGPQDLFCENLEIVCANLTDEPIPFPGLYNDMIACISDVTDSAHRVLEVVKCGENEEEDAAGECVCIEGFVETPSGICVAGEI